MFATLKLLVSEAQCMRHWQVLFFFKPGGSVGCPDRDMTLSLHVPLLTWKSIAATEVAGSLDFFFCVYITCVICVLFLVLFMNIILRPAA